MNGETAKLLRKVSTNQKHYNTLKRKWYRLSAPERTETRKQLIRELTNKESVFVPDAWKKKAGVHSGESD